MAMSALSNCDSGIDLMNPQRDLASQLSNKSDTKKKNQFLSPVKDSRYGDELELRSH